MPGKRWKELLIGTAGTPHSARARDTVAGVERVKELKLGCMEVEFVRGVKMGAKTQEKVAGTARRLGIELSAHGPYYINLNAVEKPKAEASVERVLQTARAGFGCSASTIVFHAASYMGMEPKKAYRNVLPRLKDIRNVLDDEGVDVWVRPEVMGKQGQFGSLDEVIALSQEIEGVLPCVDFSHLHARASGGYNTEEEFRAALDALEEGLGRTWLDDAHMHLQGIEYTEKGERRHLNLRESDMNYRDLLRVLKDYRVRGLLICESPNLEEDALLIKRSYARIK